MTKKTMYITGTIAVIAVITAAAIYARQSKEKYTTKPLAQTNPTMKPPIKLT